MYARRTWLTRLIHGLDANALDVSISSCLSNAECKPTGWFALIISSARKSLIQAGRFARITLRQRRKGEPPIHINLADPKDRGDRRDEDHEDGRVEHGSTTFRRMRRISDSARTPTFWL